MLRYCLILLLTTSFALTGCATTYNPATERNEFIFIGTPSEVSLGKAVAAQVSTQYKISKDQEKIKRLNKIGTKLAKVSDRKDLKYNFSVIEDKELNAFATPGGYIYVNSGLIEECSDDELACVVGHEIGHVAARHIVKKLQAQMGYDILMNIAAQKSGLGELRRAASVSYNLIMLGYSREDELLSDRLGVKYAHKASYDPRAMITFLEKLEKKNKGSKGILFLRTHPYVPQRIKMLKKEIPAIIGDVVLGSPSENSGSLEQYSSSERSESRSLSKIEKNTEPNLASEPDEKRPLKVICSVCRRIYSGETNYCPYDGTKL